MDFAYSTTSLTLDFLAAVPIDAVMTLRARVTALDRERATVSCSVFVDDQEVVRAHSEHRRVGLT
jgi:predicted transcriptional regulator